MNDLHKPTFFCVCVSLLVPLSGCKPKSPFFRNTAGYIIGDTSHIEVISSSNKTKVSDKHLNSAVLLTTTVKGGQQKYCSGTLLVAAPGKTNYRVISNHHCFLSDDEETAANSNTETASLTDDTYALCASVKVFLGFIKGQTDKAEMVTCAAGSLRFNNGADLAIFELASNPSARFAPAEFANINPVEAGRAVSIVHFPTIDDTDPSDTVYEAAVGYKLPVAQFSVDNCVTAGRFLADVWYLDKALKYGQRHTCDQKKGSSGSSLWDEATQSVLGVNWGGISISYVDPVHTEINNVATEAVFARAFAANDQATLQALQQQLTLDADGVVSRDSAASSAATTTTSKKGLLAVSCGVLGNSSPLNPIWITFAMFLWPFGLMVWRRN